MIPTNLQRSDWLPTQSSSFQREILLNKTSENCVISFKTDSNHDKQRNSNDHEEKRQMNLFLLKQSKLHFRRRFPCTLLKCCSCVSPFLQGLILGVLTGSLILGIVITLWFTSTTATTQSKTSAGNYLIYIISSSILCLLSSLLSLS